MRMITDCLDAPITEIPFHALPDVVQALLIQPLLTPALECHYQRTANILPPLHEEEDRDNQLYKRTIAMVIDTLVTRDDALKAHALNESIVIELATITVYLSSLPVEVANAVKQADVPFGTLLTQYRIPVKSADHRYFSVPYEGRLAYGRSNTLVHEDTHAVVAEVMQVLTDSTILDGK